MRALAHRESPHRSIPARAGLLASLIAIVALALVLYARTTAYGFSHYDDDALLLGPGGAVESAERPWSALGRAYFPAGGRDHAYYRPLTSLSFALDAARSGREASGYHLTNVAVHALAGCLLFFLLRSHGYAALVALLGALVFVAHPALSATVAWVPGRDDGLLAVFALAAWVLHRRAAAGAHPFVGVAHGVVWLGALLCKEAAIALPVVLVLEACLVDGRALREAVPLRVLAVWGVVLTAYVALRLAVLGADAGLGGALSAGLSGSVRALVSGLAELVWPFPPNLLAVPADMRFGRGLVALLVLAALGFWSAARPGRLLFAGAAFVVLVVPSLPAMRLLLLDSRLYLPAVPLVLLLGELTERGRFSETVRYAALGFVAVLFALHVPPELEKFRDRPSFASAAVRSSPSSSLAHRNLGVAHHEAGHLELARREYQAALEHDPDEPLVHNNLGVILMAEGRLDDAERELALELSRHPDSAEAKENLALVRRARGRAAGALSP